MEAPDRRGRPSGPRRQPPASRHKKRTRSKFQDRISSVISTSCAGLVLVALASLGCRAQQPQHQHQGQPAGAPNEYQLVGHAGSPARLPCLIGKLAHCGEPYFIAWYKLNATSRQWTRIETRGPGDDQDDEAADERPAPAAASRPLVERVQFFWSRDKSSSAPSSCLGDVAGSNQTMLLLSGRQLQQLPQAAPQPGQALVSAFQVFDCAQLTVRPLELQDEGQYKCEITFSDAVEFDRCPTSTTTQLSVIARPGEPEILLNGQTSAGLRAGNGLTFKEGAQVRLECQSAGGKPAPRIEWLNLTTWTGAGSGGAANESGAGSDSMKLNDDQSMDGRRFETPDGEPQLQRPELIVQLMRLYWPIKRATYLVSANEQSGPQQQQQVNINQNGQLIPLTSSSITITVSRFDLRSRFACLVLAPAPALAHNSISGSISAKYDPRAGELQLLGELAANLRNARALHRAAAEVPMLANARLQSPEGPQLKWIKLDVLAKPTSVAVRVLELQAEAGPAKVQQAVSAGRQSFFALAPNRLYAIQCLVENSRPKSQVVWFNRTSPVELAEPTVELATADFLQPSSGHSSRHRLSSFVRHVESEWGTFRTTSTLLLTTNFQDNFQEFFCRVSNEAFQFDEPVQVAPIISARIYVNYPPSAWLEAPGVDWSAPPVSGGQPAEASKVGRLSGESGQRLQLRCFVGANPLLQNAIVQIEWLKDGRRLSVSANSSAGRLQIERANHLHMPLASPQPLFAEQPVAGGRLAAGGDSQPEPAATNARLLTASSLTISELAKTDAGLYSCQFKLIPAPSSAGPQQVASLANISAAHSFQPPASQQQARIVSGQAGRAVQLAVIEAKLPVVLISSTGGLFVYDRLANRSRGDRPSSHRRHRLEVVVAEQSADLSLKCDSGARSAPPLPGDQLPAVPSRRVLWYLDGAFVHSTSGDLLVLRAAPNKDGAVSDADQAASSMQHKMTSGNGGRISCAHQTFEPSSSAALGNFHAQSMKLFPSSNEIDLRFKVEPKLMLTERRELLMPPVRSFSELELAAQPLSKLRLVCLAQCEPVCSVDWLVNKRPLDGGGRDSLLADEDEDEAAQLAQVQEIADNQTRIFKSARRLSSAPSDLSPTLNLVQVTNLIHRKTASNLERFPWFAQTSLLPMTSGSGVASQVELTSRQLMRDSYELANSLTSAKGEPPLAWNVLSKLELSYSQIGQLFSAASGAKAGSQWDALPSGPRAGNDDELLVECKLDETFAGRMSFGSAHVKANVFHPTLKQDDDRADESVFDADEAPGSSVLATPLNEGRVRVPSLLSASSQLTTGSREAARQDAKAAASIQMRIMLERTSRTMADVQAATVAPPLLEQTHLINNLQRGNQAGSFPAFLDAQLATNKTSESQLKIASSHHQTQQQQPFLPNSQAPNIGSSVSTVRSWFASNQERLLVGVSLVVLVWLLVLFISPLVQRHLSSSPKLGFGGPMARSASNPITDWRYNRHNKQSSRTSSTHEIGTTGNGNGSSSSSSSMMMARKFGLYEANQTYGLAIAAAAPNYYGLPESNEVESSEHDLAQSCSQSSNYEEFIQHQLQHRLQQQPLYFNQKQMVESTTLSRRPLVQCTSQGTRKNFARRTNGLEQRAQQQLPATMRLNQANVPLINGFNGGTSSRICLDNIQRRSRDSPLDEGPSNPFSKPVFKQHYSFGQSFQSARDQDGTSNRKPRTRNNELQEHIYDDVG